MKSKLFLTCLFLMLLFAQCNKAQNSQNSAGSQDWPQFLGPERNSTSPETGILRSWPETGPEILWTTNVGIGYGGVVIGKGKVYFLDRNEDKGDIMRCFDLNDGKELWQYAYEAPGSVMFPGSRSVPALDGNYVYSVGGFGDLYCIDITTHQPVWHTNIWTGFGGDSGNAEPGNDGGGSGGGPGGFAPRGNFPIWAISQCPLVYGDLVIVASQAPEAGVVAYDKLKGDVVWKTPNLGNESYVSPAIVKIDGEDHVVMITSSTNPVGHPELPKTPGNVTGIDPLTGKILWNYPGWECHISVASAVDAGNNKILVVGGYEHGAMMIQVDKQSDGSYVPKELFKTVEFGEHTKPPILHNGYFYAQYSTNNRRDGLACMSMEGEVMWKTKRDPDFNKGSMILVDGVLLATDGAKKLYVIEPDPGGFKPLASAELLTAPPAGEGMSGRFGTMNWAPIALSGGKLLIRDQSRLICVKVAQ